MKREKIHDTLLKRYLKTEYEHGLRSLVLSMSNTELKILRILAVEEPKTRYEIYRDFHIPYQLVHPSINRLIRMNLVRELESETDRPIPRYTLSLFGLCVVIFYVYLRFLEKSPIFEKVKNDLVKSGMKTSNRMVLKRLLSDEQWNLIDFTQDFINDLRRILLNE